MKINFEKLLILLIIGVTIASIAYLLTTKKSEREEILTSQLLLNASNLTLIDILNEKPIQITTERPLNRTTSSYYNTTFSSERKFVKFGNSIVVDVEVYYFDNSTERGRVVNRFVEENTNRFFVNVEKSIIDDWSATLFDFRSIIDGRINGWGAILEKDNKVIYFISHFSIEKNEREEVIKWILRKF